jgi:cytochrome P450
MTTVHEPRPLIESDAGAGARGDALPAGPSLPLALQTARIHLGVAGFFDENFRRYGDIFTLRVYPFGTAVVVADPASAKLVLTGHEDTFRAGEVNQIAEPLLGPTSVFLKDDPDDHLRARRFLLPPFHGERITRYAERIAAIARTEIETWPEGESFAVHPRMQAIAMEVILRIIFGVADPEQLAEIRRHLVAMRGPAESVILFPWLRRNFGPWSPWARFERHQAKVDRLIYEHIDRGRSDPALPDRDDILAMLLAAKDADGRPMPDNEIRDVLLTMVLAGYETTATALAWAVERLAWHQRALGTLRASLNAGEDEYVDAVIKETLRLRPPLWHLGRRLSADTQIKGYTIPAGTLVIVPMLTMHRRADLYPAPEMFRPERYIEGKPPSYGWLPFGGGVRRCIGASFAPLEMRLVLRELLRRFTFVPAERTPEKIKLFHVMIVPEHGASVVLRRVSASDNGHGEVASHLQAAARGCPHAAALAGQSSDR